MKMVQAALTAAPGLQRLLNRSLTYPNVDSVLKYNKEHLLSLL